MILWINLAASISLVLLYSGTSHSLDYLELKPRIREQLRAVGDSFFITCLSLKHDNIDLYDIKWKFPSGTTVTNTGRVHIEKTGEGFELVFSKVSESDGGEYTCTAQASDVGTVEKTFRLEVYKKISFDEAPPEQIAKENEDFVLKCRVSGLPKPKINWKAGGDILKTGEKYEYVEDGLLIHNIEKQDSKKYECKALQISNTTSAFDLRIITLKVSYAPVWKNNNNRYPSDHFSWIGGTVTLNCAAEGIPTPTIKWYKNDIHLENSNDMKITSHEGHSTLKIEVINKAIYGRYTCEAVNTIDTLQRIYTLNEAEKPGPPIVTAESHSMNSIHLDIQPPRKSGGLEIKGYKVYYILGSQKWESDKQTSLEFSKSDNYILESLKPGTTYKIRVAAKTEIGYGKLTEEVVCSTKTGGVSSTRSGSTSSAAWLAVKLDILFLPILVVVCSSGNIVR